MLMEIGRGTISSIRGVGESKADLIPVDIVCNTLITAAWANSFVKTSSIPVYNYTSGQVNPLTWQGVADGVMKYARKYPSKYIMMYPEYSYRTNLKTHFIYEMLLHFFPVIIFDIFLMIQGKKPFMLKVAKRFKATSDNGCYFTINDWNFEAGNVQRIIRAARETQLDAHEFNCDVSSLDWDEYLEKYMIGVRTFILKDDLSSLPSSRKKLKKIIWTKRITQLLLLIAAYYIIFCVFWR
jgi:alcohol-forming fatty acyl-CoA reductase